jgi:hypothetical protein
VAGQTSAPIRGEAAAGEALQAALVWLRSFDYADMQGAEAARNILAHIAGMESTLAQRHVPYDVYNRLVIQRDQLRADLSLARIDLHNVTLAATQNKQLCEEAQAEITRLRIYETACINMPQGGIMHAHAMMVRDVDDLRAELAKANEIVYLARGLSHGTDWNKGTHAKAYRHKLIKALSDMPKGDV